MSNTKHTPEAEALADAILKAAGSGLRHYSLPKTREAIFAAAQQGIDESRQELLTALNAASDWIDAQLFEPRTDIQATVQQAIANATNRPCGHCLPRLGTAKAKGEAA